MLAMFVGVSLATADFIANSEAANCDLYTARFSSIGVIAVMTAGTQAMQSGGEH